MIALYQAKQITLEVEMDTPQKMACYYMEFLMVDCRSIYHRVLETPALKKL